jgi:hypothetical protein
MNWSDVSDHSKWHVCVSNAQISIVICRLIASVAGTPAPGAALFSCALHPAVRATILARSQQGDITNNDLSAVHLFAAVFVVPGACREPPFDEQLRALL